MQEHATLFIKKNFTYLEIVMKESIDIQAKTKYELIEQIKKYTNLEN